MQTTNRLADKRMVSTYFATVGNQVLVLETGHYRHGKRIETEVYVAEREEYGGLVRHMTIGRPSVGMGITLAREPIARWSAKRAWEMHDFALQNLYHLLAAESGDVAAELLALLEQSEDARVAAWYGAWKS